MTTQNGEKSQHTHHYPSLPSLEDYAFFSVAVGFGMPWTALSSELGYLKTLHGPTFLLYLNLASCAPCLPTLVLQLIFDQGHNHRFGTAKATMVRQCCSLLLCTLCTASLPFLPWNQKPVLLAVAAIIGAAGSVAFGSASQLVARFSAKCGQALALGIVAAGPTVLLLQALLRITAHPSPLQQHLFFLLAALAPLNALFAISTLVLKHWEELQEDAHMHAHGPHMSWGQGTISESMHESADHDWDISPGPNPLAGPSGFHGGLRVPRRSSDFGGLPRPYSADFCGLPRPFSFDFGGSPMSSAAVPLLPATDEIAVMDLLPASFGSMPGMMPQGADAMLLLPDATGFDHDHETMTLRSCRSCMTTIRAIPPSVLAAGPSSVIEFAVQQGLWSAAKAVAPLALSLGSSMGVTVMLFPLFTVVRSSGLLGSMLPQALFAACMLPDILGRMIARSGVPSLAIVEVLAVVKFASLAPALAYLWFPARLLSDVAVVAFVIVHWLINGLIGAWAYMLLPQALPDPQAAALGGAVMSTAFQAFSICGLIAAVLLEHLAHPPMAS